MGYINNGDYENADTPDPITQSLYCCPGEVLNIKDYNSHDL